MGIIHENLVLDHVYFSATAEEFDELKEIFLQFGCASHSVVQAEDDSWEGIYIQTRGQNYLEILKVRRTGGIGFCQRAMTPLSQNAQHIVEDFPTLPWKTFERKADGQKWFTALSCDNYLDLATPFNTWVMYYHQRDIKKSFPLKKYDIVKFNRIEFSANPNLVDRIKLNSTWFNAKMNFSEKEIIFDVQTFYSDPYKMVITLDNKNEGIHFKNAEFELHPNFKINDLNLKYFELSSVYGKTTLKKIN